MARLTEIKKAAPQRPGLCCAKTRSLKGQMPFCYRYRLDDPFLQDSIKRSGVLMPVLVTHGDRPTVVAGHKRLFAARALKLKTVPVLGVGRMGSRDAFLLNLVSNWKQNCSETDRAKALGMAVRQFSFSGEDIVRLIMPLLGLPGDKVLLELYRKIDRCPPPVKDLIESGQLPLRGMMSLLKFSKRDQTYFSKEVFARAKLTSSQLLQAGEWLADLIKGTGKDLKTILEEHKVLKGLDVRGMDPRSKADRFFTSIKRLRFPGYSSYLEEFEERRSSILKDAKDLRLEPVQGFEEPGFELHARVKTLAELDRLLRRISEKRSALNSLFEIVL